MEKIAVYGSGTIGSCEATLIIGHGIPCTVIGHSERGLERCRKAVAQNWDDLIANGLASEDNKAAALELLTVTNDRWRAAPMFLKPWRKARRKSRRCMRPLPNMRSRMQWWLPAPPP